MPNHVHFIWQQLIKMEKKRHRELFEIYTSRIFKKLKQNETSKNYALNAANKKHETWSMK